MDDKAKPSKRIPFRYTIKYGPVNPPEFTSFVTNLSETGLCIKTNKIFKPGTTLYMIIELPGGVFNTEGVVIWAKASPPALVRHVRTGMGIKFTKTDPELLKAYYAKKGD